MGRDDDLDWSIEEDPIGTAGEAPEETPTPAPSASPTLLARPAWLTWRITAALFLVVAGAIGLAVGATWWQSQIQRAALETEVRVIDQTYRDQSRELYAALSTQAADPTPSDRDWVYNQTWLYVNGVAATPLDWPKLAENGEATVIERRALNLDQSVARVLRGYIDPNDASAAPWQFVTVEAYSRTAAGDWIRTPLPDIPERLVDQARTDGAVRWVYDALDKDAVGTLAPLVAADFARLCAAGLPCPDTGELSVRILPVGESLPNSHWTANTDTDAADVLAATLGSTGNSASLGQLTTLVRAPFAETGIPVGPPEQRALARQVTIELLGHWLAARMRADDAYAGAAYWGGLGLWTAGRADILESAERDAPPRGLFGQQHLWTADRSNPHALREAAAVLTSVLNAESNVDAAALWAGLPHADSPAAWLNGGLGWTDAEERLARVDPPIALQVNAIGELDGVLACYLEGLRYGWAGWQRGITETAPILGTNQETELSEILVPVSLSPDGRRVLLTAGARMFALDVAAGTAIHLPDNVDNTRGQIRWWGNDAVLVATELGITADHLVRLDAPETVTDAPIFPSQFLVSRSGQQALGLLVAGTGNSSVETIDLVHGTRASVKFERDALTTREYGADRFWTLARQEGQDTFALQGVQLDPMRGAEPGLLYILPRPGDDLREHILSVDSLHGHAAVSYSDANGTTRVTVIYRLIGLRGVEVSRIRQATPGIPQMAFSADGTVLFITNGAADASYTSTDAFLVENGEILGSLTQAFPVALEDGVTHELLVGPDGLYLNEGLDSGPLMLRFRSVVWDGRTPPQVAGPTGCLITAARYRP